MKTIIRRTAATLALGLSLVSCAGGSIPAKAPPPGAEKTTTSSALEAGAALLQSKPPLDALNMYLDGFHFQADDMGHQMGARHYCAQLNDEFIQCVLYDANAKDAKLVGVEYIVSEDVFESLPKEEKRLWHSHRYEVKSGALVAPGIPGPAEHALMEKVVSTYGKTWHTWSAERDELPLGPPVLMMGFTADGQLRPELQRERDQQLGVSSDDKRRERQDIPTPAPIPGADVWRSGKSYQLTITGTRMKGAPKATSQESRGTKRGLSRGSGTTGVDDGEDQEDLPDNP